MSTVAPKKVVAKKATAPKKVVAKKATAPKKTAAKKAAVPKKVAAKKAAVPKKVVRKVKKAAAKINKQAVVGKEVLAKASIKRAMVAASHQSASAGTKARISGVAILAMRAILQNALLEMFHTATLTAKLAGRSTVTAKDIEMVIATCAPRKQLMGEKVDASVRECRVVSDGTLRTLAAASGVARISKQALQAARGAAQSALQEVVESAVIFMELKKAKTISAEHIREGYQKVGTVHTRLLI